LVKRLIILIFAICAVLPAFAADEIIDDIRIKGLMTMEEKFVLDRISYGIGMAYSKYKTREDIRKLYETGRFDDIKVSTAKEGDKTLLVYELTEKPLIGKVLIKGNKDVGEGDIKSKLEPETESNVNPASADATKPQAAEPEDEGKPSQKIKEGEYFDEYYLKAAIVKIEKLYKEKNFYYATVKYSVSEPSEEQGKKGKRVTVTIEAEEGDKIKVKTITATGNNVFGVDKIKGAMKTKEEGWFVSGVFDDDQFIEDMKAVLNSYFTEGYVKAKVNGLSIGEIEANRKKLIEDCVKFNRTEKIITINIPVTEGMQYKIKDIAYRGNEIFTVEEFTDRIESRAGRVFDKPKFERDLNSLRSMYSEKGRIFAQVKEAYVYDDDTGEVSAAIDVTEGPVAYVNEVKVRGNYVTKDKVILRELTVAAGEPFDSSKIRKSQEAVYNLGFFDNVVIDTEQVGLDRLNLVFEVTERKTNTIGLGAGYSTVEGLVGYLQLTNANLFGEGKSFSADVQVGNNKKSWQLGYKDPWLFDTPVSFGLDIWNAFKNRGYNNQGYDLDSYGLDLSLGYRIDLEQKAFITYRYEEGKFSNIDEDLKDSVKEGKSQISSIMPMYVFDNRDDVFDPGRGVYTSLSAQFGGGLLGGDYNYIKAVWDYRYFVPSIWKFVLGIHVRVGNAWLYDWAYGDAALPPTEKFFAGGTDTVRGYEERSLGPGIAGGNFLFVSNIEYKLKVIDRVLTLAAFYDSGNCWNNVQEVNFGNPYLYPSIGGGVRFTIPGTVMLIRIDYGYPLLPEYNQYGGKIHFNIGNIF